MNVQVYIQPYGGGDATANTGAGISVGVLIQ